MLALRAHAGQNENKPRPVGGCMSELNRRTMAQLALGGAAALAALSAPRRGWAQTWPARPVILIVPYPPGGVADPEARVVADALSRALGQSFVVQNKPGAAGQ